MRKSQLLNCFFIVLFLAVSFNACARAESAFDFGLPLFGYEEVRFEKTKAPDFNFQLLKKYLNEYQDSTLHQFHAISRWFSLIKLSDTPRRAELIKLGSEYFSTAKVKDISPSERLREIFFSGLLLANEKQEDANKDEAFEELLLASEKLLGENGDYFLIKGIIFHYLRNRSSGYFSPMKPEEDLKKALTMISKTAHYYFVMAQAFRLLGTDESSLFLAIASYEKSASLDPRNPKLQNSLLGIYMGLHEDFQARGKAEPFWLEEAVYKKILTLSPNNPFALNNLGYLYAEYGVNTAIAQELCQKAVDLSPDNPGFRDSLGWAAFKNRDYRKSEEELKKSLAMRNNGHDPHYHLATLYYATEELAKAEEYYRLALKFKPDSAESLNNLAYLLAEQNRKIDEAASMAEKAVKLEPGNASYLDTLGWLLYRAGKTDQALATLLKSSQMAPGQGEILMHIGIVYLDKGQFSTALDYLRQAQKADPNLKETESAIYMALRLKGYYTSLSEYHTMFGEKADRDRVCHILTGISQLYQEEKQYDKAIDYTKMCAEVRNGKISLKEPLFSFYSLPEKVAEKGNETAADPELPTTTIAADEEIPAGEPTEKVEELEKIPANPGFPLVINIGPDTFRIGKRWVTGLESLEGLSFTFFIKHLLKPARELILRIESGSQSGNSLIAMVAGFFRRLNTTITETGNPDQLIIKFGRKQLFIVADQHAIYLFPNQITEPQIIEQLNEICPHYDDMLGSVFYDWNELKKQIPELLKPFISNPMSPFIKSVSRYSYNNGTFSEFSLLTTGKEEDNSFVQKFARRLFSFKVQAAEMGVDATIKVRGDADLIYLLIDFNGVGQVIQKRLPPIIRQILLRLSQTVFSRHLCFINRMFFNPDAENTCPAGGKIEIDPVSGLIRCNIHKDQPAIPVFFNEKDLCNFRRKLIEDILKNRPQKPNQTESNENLPNDIMKEYNVPGCPASGTWKIDEKGKINCPEHEN